MKTLVFLHGWGASGRIWERQAEAFQARRPVLTPTIPAWEVSWVKDFLKDLPLPDCLLVGWSLGGMLLVEALAELEARPAALVLAGVAASFCPRADYPLGQPPGGVRAMRRAVKIDAGRVVGDFARQCLAPGESSFLPELLERMQPGQSPEELARGLDYLLARDLRPDLARLNGGRVTIIQGDQDRITAAAQAQFLHRRLPGSRLKIIAGAGHLPFFTRAAEFNEVLEEILGGGRGT